MKHKNHDDLSYEGIGFSKSAVAAMSEEQFVAHESHQQLTEAQLKEVYALATAGKEVEKVEKAKPGKR